MRRSKGEKRVEQYLIKHQIPYKFQYKFPDCIFKYKLAFDFATFDENNNIKFLIEYDGKQHFYPIKHFGGYDQLLRQQHHDDVKTEYCIKNGYKLIRISYKDYNNIENILDEFFFKNKEPDMKIIWKYRTLADRQMELDESKESYDMLLDDDCDIRYTINDYIDEQLTQLKKEGLYDLYLYLVELYHLPVADNDGELFYDILTTDYR